MTHGDITKHAHIFIERLASSSDPHPDTLFWHSSWHTIWKCILGVYMYIYMYVCMYVYIYIIHIYWIYLTLFLAYTLTFYSGILSGIRGWGLAVPTEIWHLRLRSWRSQLRSSNAHWSRELMVEDEEEKKEKEKATLIKSRDSHLACEEWWQPYLYILVYGCIWHILVLDSISISSISI